MATLMNLSLRHDGKVECEAPSLRLLESLCDILEHENVQVRTYVNGTLYSLLTRQVFKDRAHALGLPEMLQCLADVPPLPPSLARRPAIANRSSGVGEEHRAAAAVHSGPDRMRGACAVTCAVTCAFTPHQHDRAQAVDDDSVGDDAGDEENDEPVSGCRQQSHVVRLSWRALLLRALMPTPVSRPTRMTTICWKQKSTPMFCRSKESMPRSRANLFSPWSTLRCVLQLLAHELLF